MNFDPDLCRHMESLGHNVSKVAMMLCISMRIVLSSTTVSNSDERYGSRYHVMHVFILMDP